MPPNTEPPATEPPADSQLAAAWLARISRTRVLAGFVVAAFSLSWIVWILGIVIARPRSIGDEGFAPALIVGSFGPTVAAVATVLVVGGWPALRWLGRRWGRFRARWWVWLVVFFALPVVYTGVLLVVGARPAIEPWMLAITVAVVPINALLVGVLFGVGPLGEETGWRGILSPALDRRGGRVRAALIVGLVWAAWHAPLAVFDDWRGDIAPALFALTYPVTLIAFSFAIVWVMRWSRHSIIIAVLFHGVFNLTASIMNDPDIWSYADLGPETLAIAGTTAVVIVALGCELLGRTRASQRAIDSLAARFADRPE